MNQSSVWIARNHRADDEYDRRRFLGIGATPDFPALAEEWKSSGGWRCEMRLAWIFACGPESLRDRIEAWSWLMLGEVRLGDACDETELPTLSVPLLRERLMKRISEKNRQRLREDAKKQAYDEYVRSR